MARRNPDQPSPRRAPARTPEARNNQLISAAVDLAEKQMLEGTASAQVITHYLKQSSAREKLELQRIKHENDLLKARKESIESQARFEEKMEEAVQAFKGYKSSALEVEDEYYSD